MLFVAAACSPAAAPERSAPAADSAATATERTAPTPTGSAPAPTPSNSTTALVVVSPFGRHDVPPGAVAEWSAYGSNTETSGGCDEAGAGSPVVLLQPSDGSGIPTFACAGVFEVGSEVTFELILPNGASIDHREVVDESGVAIWTALPLQPPTQGRYEIRASQDAKTTSSTVDARATEPTLVVSPYSTRVGGDIQVIVAGTSVPVELYLYQPENREVGEGLLMPGWAFVTTLGTVSPDATRDGSLTIRSNVGDIATRYRIEGDGLYGAEFELVP
jgi:hypothetical protein